MAKRGPKKIKNWLRQGAQKGKTAFCTFCAAGKHSYGVRKVKQLKRAPKKEKASQHKKTTKPTTSTNKFRSLW